MRRDITNKLTKFLSREITEECEVVYILVEVRKIIEHLKAQLSNNNYSLLKFYCDWALHIKLDRSDVAGEIINKLDKAIKDYYDGRENEDSLPIRITEIISFNKFKNELSEFLSKFIFFNNLLENKHWEIFCMLFVDIIADCPLMTKNKINHVKKFLITKKHHKTSAMWQIELNEDEGVSLKLIGSLINKNYL